MFSGCGYTMAVDCPNIRQVQLVLPEIAAKYLISDIYKMPRNICLSTMQPKCVSVVIGKKETLCNHTQAGDVLSKMSNCEILKNMLYYQNLLKDKTLAQYFTLKIFIVKEWGCFILY